MPRFQNCAQIPGCLRGALGCAVAALLIAASPRPAGAQELLDALHGLSGGVARQYLDPAASSGGAALNAGWFYRPPDPLLIGFSLDFGVVTANGLFFRAPRHFEGSGAIAFTGAQARLIVDSAFKALGNDPRVAGLSADQREALLDTLAGRVSGPELQATFRGPTVIGPSGDSLFVTFKGTTLNLKGLPSASGGTFDTTLDISPRQVKSPLVAALHNLPFLPLACPRVTLGTFWGTQASFRYMPPIEIEADVGKVSLIGFGVQHNLATWFGMESPADVTVDVHAQRMEVEDTFIADALGGGVVVSKTFGDRHLGVIPFGGFALESSNIESDYVLVLDTPHGVQRRKIKFEIDGSNDVHYTLGSSFQFFHFNLSGEYNFADFDSFSVGLMFML